MYTLFTCAQFARYQLQQGYFGNGLNAPELTGEIHETVCSDDFQEASHGDARQQEHAKQQRGCREQPCRPCVQTIIAYTQRLTHGTYHEYSQL